MNFKNMFVMGDRHGNLPETQYMVKDVLKRYGEEFGARDVIENMFFVAGDAGYIWSGIPKETYDLAMFNKFLKTWNSMLCIVPGNHENYTLINELPLESFAGGVARRCASNIMYLESGQIYYFNDKRFFTYGGATSVDKMYRVENISWWKEEIPGFATEKMALENLEKVENKVDVIISHTAPNTLIPNNHYKRDFEPCPVSKFLDHVLALVDYKMWFCGHFHIDEINPCGLHFLYHTMVRIPD